MYKHKLSAHSSDRGFVYEYAGESVRTDRFLGGVTVSPLTCSSLNVCGLMSHKMHTST